MSARPSGKARLHGAEGHVFETPTDVFRRRLAVGILVGVGVLFLVLVGGSMFVLTRGGENEKALTTAQVVLTTSIGFIGGVLTTTVGYFFQPKEV